MSLTMTIDGAKHSGHYRVVCECGGVWTGEGEPIGAVNWSPALPVAEAVVHMKMGHEGGYVDLRMTERFREWLISYWERASLRQANAAWKRSGTPTAGVQR